MSNLDYKSEENLKASTILIENGLYASSVHCAYYAAFQKLICKLILLSDKDISEIQEGSRARGSHKLVIDDVFHHLRKKCDTLPTIKREAAKARLHKAKRGINDLKLLRVESDYHDKRIGIKEGEKSLKISKEFIKKLNQNFE